MKEKEIPGAEIQKYAYGKYVKILRFFQQIPIGLQKLITFETTLPWRIGLILNEFIFDLKIIDIELPLLITIRDFIIKISRVI